MINKYFKVLRSGTHTTFQDKGFVNLQHLGITTSGVVDNELAFIAVSYTHLTLPTIYSV